MVIGRKGAHADVFERISKAGLLKARVDGELIDIDNPPTLALRKEHTISAVVDRSLCERKTMFGSSSPFNRR